jgi:excisionase family DNA binding protein
MEEVDGWEIFTLADAYNNTDPDPGEREASYRRGYRDGFVEAVNALGGIWFLGKNWAIEELYSFSDKDLFKWEFDRTTWLPPDFGVKCVYCGKPAVHLDHVIPRSRGGLNGRENLVPSCARCNCGKSNRMPAEVENDRNNSGEFITVREAAISIGVSQETIRRWIRTGKITATNFKTRYYINRSLFESFRLYRQGE